MAAFSLRRRAALSVQLLGRAFRLFRRPALHGQTGVPSRPPSASSSRAATRSFQDMVEAAKILVPGLAQIALVGDSLEREPLRGRYQQDMQQIAKALDVVNLSNLSLDQVRM